MQKVIDVTQADLDAGVQQSRHYCPIALAVNRECGEDTADVGYTLTIRHWNGVERLFISFRLRDKIDAIDGGAEVSPFSIVIDYDNRKVDIDSL